MKMSRKRASLLGLAATTLITVPGFMGCVYGPDPTFQGDGSGAYVQPSPAATETDAFELAKIINENSNIDIELLGEAGASEGQGNTEEQVEAVPGGTYDGGVKAYAFPYPKGSDKMYWTQVYVESDGYDLLGIHVGDDISVIKEVMEEYGFSFSESTDRVYTSKDVDHEDIYQNGDVHFCFYMKGDTLVYMLVTVHE